MVEVRTPLFHEMYPGWGQKATLKRQKEDTSGDNRGPVQHATAGPGTVRSDVDATCSTTAAQNSVGAGSDRDSTPPVFGDVRARWRPWARTRGATRSASQVRYSFGA